MTSQQDPSPLALSDQSAHTEQQSKRSRAWTLAIVSIGLFMVVLDNLVVNVALPSIRRELGASIQSLEWTVNAYVLAYAVLLLTGAALGDRFGRRRMFAFGIGLFTLSSAGAALAGSADLLIAARALQGVGAAIATPLTLTLLAEAFPQERRGIAIGIWSGISGIAVALGPLVGGAVVQAATWHWIFWINVPIGLVLVPLALTRLDESYGTARRLDLRGLLLELGRPVRNRLRTRSVAVARLDEHSRSSSRWPAARCCWSAFVAYELRTPEPMLPMRFFAQRSFTVTNAVSLSMYFGMFGSIFFLSQYPAERAAQHAASGRRQAPGLDRRDDGRLAAGGILLGALRIAPVHGRRPQPAGDRAWLARDPGVDDPELREHDRPVHPRRCRHGARVRARGQRGPLLGQDRPRRARPPEPRTRSASSAACSASRSWRRCSPATAATPRRRPTSTG